MECDVVVVGLGPGGEEAAGKLAESGLNVVGVEAELLGGECPYWGCIPSKMMVRASDLLAEGRRIPGMAGKSVITPDWSPVARRIRQEATDTWDDTAAVERFEGKGGRLVRGKARVTGADSVEVGGRASARKTRPGWSTWPARNPRIWAMPRSYGRPGCWPATCGNIVGKPATET